MKILYAVADGGQLALDPAVTDALLADSGRVVGWRHRPPGQAERLLAAEEVQVMADEGKSFVMNSPYPARTNCGGEVTADIGLSERQRTEVRAIIADHDRAAVLRLQSARMP